jgi:phenylacetate-CoA ligase
MSLIRSLIRSLAEKAPSVPGAVRALSYVPFALRKGSDFGRFQDEAKAFKILSGAAKKQWIFEKTLSLVKHAENKVEFYRQFYVAAGFSSDELKGYEDLSLIPIITKADLKEYSLEGRSALAIQALNSNTGGTTGQPLSFRIEKSLRDKEWAYIYYMWQRRGWRAGFLKLRFGGTNLGNRPFQYVPTEGEFLVNTYMGQDEICQVLVTLLKRFPIHYLHGYPSALGAFARHASEHYQDDLVIPIRKHLRGILLGSEFPTPCYRDIIEETFGHKTISWYGHSEKAVLAGEKDEPYVYHPFQSYGWVEAIENSGSTSRRLIGTNFHGYACPFIRYDTGDTVNLVQENDGLLESFRIAEGRIGDMVKDAEGNEISLTALIFGRHHSVFADVQHIQVAQLTPGKVLLLASGLPDVPERRQRFWAGFDTSGVDIDFEVKFLDEPVRTPVGKVALKVPYPKG